MRAIFTAAVWVVVVVVVRMLLSSAFDRYEQRLAESDPMVAARRRTTFRFLLQVIVALVAVIGVWSVLSIFPATQQVASAFLGSAAVLAVIAGLALSTPLGSTSARASCSPSRSRSGSVTGSRCRITRGSSTRSH